MHFMNNVFKIARCNAGVRAGLLLLVTLVIAGCNGNGLLIRYFYGQIDNNLYDRITAYASFNEVQKSQIRNSVDHYARWHRQTELPRYAAFLDQIIAALEAGTISNQLAFDYLLQGRELTEIGFRQSPFNQSSEFLRGLSDQQVDEIEAYFSLQDEKFFKWHEKRQRQGGESRMLKSIVRNIGRIGVKLNTEQKKIIEEGLAKYQGDSMTRYKIYNRWRSELVRLLRNRNQADFVEAVSVHISAYQDQLKIADPQRHLHNQQNSAQIIARVVDSLDPGQKKKLNNRIQQTRNTLIAMSAG